MTPFAHALDYSVHWKGLTEGSLFDALESRSECVSNRDRAPASVLHLQRRIDRDIEGFSTILRAEGYYDASVRAEIDESNSPLAVTFSVNPGDRFVFAAVEVVSEPAADFSWPARGDLGLIEHEPALSNVIVDAEPILLKCAKHSGYPFAVAEGRSVIVDHATKTVDVTYHIVLGPRATFGPIVIEGLTSMKEAVVRRVVAWHAGDPFDEALFDKTRERLYALDLFSLVQIAPGESVDSEGRVPVTISVAERKHRTLQLGGWFETEKGPAFSAGWEHRNINALGYKLTLKTEISENEQSADAGYEIPGFRRDDQVLRLHLRFANESSDAFDSTHAGVDVGVERTLDTQWTAGAGVRLRIAGEEQQEIEETYTLLSLPVYGVRNTTDNPLDPKTGMALNLRVEPFVGVSDSGVAFVKASVNWSRYFALDSEGDWVLAARFKVGSIAGAELRDVPPDERFYAGGGGSIRGYEYKTVGPLIDNDPIGGRSLVESSLELRRTVTKNVSIAAFVDGGNVYSSSWPKLDGDLRWGAGVGVRYQTPVGPLRVDIAVPLDRRHDVDDQFGVYVGFGQSF